MATPPQTRLPAKSASTGWPWVVWMAALSPLLLVFILISWPLVSYHGHQCTDPGGPGVHLIVSSPLWMPYLYILCRLHWKWTSGFILPLVAYLVFLVVWAEAIPGLLRSPIAAHQASAVGSLRTINTAEFTYSSTYPRGFSPTLPALGPPPGNAETTASAAGLLDDVLAGGRKNGYTFAYLPGPKDSAGRITSYTVVARPLDGSCGTNSYFTDKSGVIRMTEENRPATAKDPPLSY